MKDETINELREALQLESKKIEQVDSTDTRSSHISNGSNSSEHDISERHKKKKNRTNDVSLFRKSNSLDYTELDSVSQARMQLLEESVAKNLIVIQELETDYANMRSQKICLEEEYALLKNDQSLRIVSEELDSANRRLIELQSKLDDTELKLVEIKTEAAMDHFKRSSVIQRKASISASHSAKSSPIEQNSNLLVMEQMEDMCLEYEDKCSSLEIEKMNLIQENLRYTLTDA